MIPVMGDFNCVLDASATERVSEQPMVPMSSFGELNDVLDDCQLSDLEFAGCVMTWDNQRGGKDKVACKLDRILVNGSWRLNMSTSALFDLPDESDHSPCCVVCGYI